MKKKLLLLLCLTALAVSLLASCKLLGGTGSSGGNQNQQASGDAIYGRDTVVGIVIADDSFPSSLVSDVSNALYNWNALPELIDPNGADAKVREHEIVFGECDREVSKKAYTYLSRMDEELHHSNYVMYSDGKSIAIAYDHSAGLEYIFPILLEKYLCYSELKLEKGVYEQGTVSILDYYAEKDAERIESDWKALEKKLGPEYGPAIVEAFKEYYTHYNHDVVLWLANLYDPEAGGFYFSNSGRDTPGYAPDLESTSQALGFIENMGAYARDVIPYEMKQKMGQFAYNMQDPNGFFYHPQWTKESTDAHLSRRARDLGHAAGLLSMAGMTPKYPLATDQIESTDPMSTINLTNRLGASSVAAVSKVVAVEATVPHLANKEAFLTYLRGLGIYNNSYGPGNQISAQFSQIKAAGLADVCVDYFESIQNPKNGLWEDDVKYGSINGLLKISGMWANVGRVFPYAKEAIASTIECIMSEEPTGGVVAMYNCWYSICNINSSMKYASGSDGSEFVKETRETLYKLAPDAIRLTAQKVMQCQKPDGSFSWGDKYSSTTSQGMPVAVPYSEEGDVNATVIGYSGAIGRCFEALGLSRVASMGQRELYLFLYTLENLGAIVKQDSIFVGEPIDFEDWAVDTQPDDIQVSVGEGSSALIALDPTGKDNKVLHYQSAPGNGDCIYVPNTVGMEANCMVFSGDFYISSNNSKGYFMQMTMDKCYLFTFQTDSEGYIRVIDTNSSSSSNAIYNTFDTKLNFDEWFNLKIEYYAGDADTVRIKVYINDKLVGVTDNFWNQDGNKFTETVTPGTNAVETRLYCMMSSTIDMYLDNLHAYKLNKSYEIEHPENPYAPDVDAADKDEQIFDFEDFNKDVVYSENQNVEYHEQIVVYDGTYTLSNGNKSTYSSAGVTASEFNGSKSILINTSGSNAKLQIPTTVRTSAGNCGTLGFDVQVTSASLGDFALIKFYDKNDSANTSSVIMGITLSCIEENGEKFIVMKEMPGGVVSAQLDGVKIPLGNIVNMRFEFFHKEDATLVFIDDVSCAASYSIFTGGQKYTLGYASIETIGKVASTIQIDNVKCERIERSYAMATAPNVDRDVYHFDDTNGVEISGGAAVNKVNGNNVLKINKDGKVTLPINLRSPVVNVTTFESIINFSAAPKESKTYIRFYSENMEELFGVVLSGDGNNMVMRELTQYGETANVLTRFAIDNEYTLKLEICPSKETVNVIVNGTAVYVTNVFFDDEKLEEKLTYVSIESSGAQLYIDETYAEAVNTVFVQCKPNVGENSENAAPKYTFETSSSVSIPKKITTTLKSSGAAKRIKSAFRNGEITNVLAFVTTKGGNDTLSFSSMNTVAGANCAVFETDICFEGFGGNVAQFSIGGAYMFTIGVDKNGNPTIGALTAGSDAGRVWGKAAILPANGTWFNLRIEVFTGDMNTTLAKVYVDGELILVTNNYKGYRNNTETPVAPSTDVSSAYFYCYTDAIGTILVDNTSFDLQNISKGDYELTDPRPAYVAPAQ